MQVKMAAAALLVLSAVSALAQAPSIYPGMLSGYGLSRSDDVADIASTETRSVSPAVGQDAESRDYLPIAHTALAGGRTGEAQESLEMAETRLLTPVNH